MLRPIRRTGLLYCVQVFPHRVWNPVYCVRGPCGGARSGSLLQGAESDGCQVGYYVSPAPPGSGELSCSGTKREENSTLMDFD